MARPPKGRHSRTAKDPVTIDLEADKVSDATAGTGSDEKTEAGGQSTGDTAKAATTAPTDKAASRSPDSKSSQAKPASGAASSAPKTASQKPDTARDKPAAAGPGKAEAKASDKTTAPKSASTGSSPGDESKASSSFAGTAAPPPPGAMPGARRGAGLTGGIIGGIIVLAGIFGLQWAGLWPAADDDNEARIAGLENDVGELQQTLADIELAIGDDAPAARLEGIEGEFQTLRGDLDTLQTELAELSDSEPEQVDLSPVEDRLAALEEGMPDLAAGDTRMGEIEQRLDGLAQRIEEQAGSASAALVIAGSSLQAAVERGGDFTGELNTLEQLAPETDGLDELRAYAESGVASRARLTEEVDQAANAMIQAARSEADPDAGFMERLFSSAEGLVAVRPVGEVEGEGVPATVARLEAAVQADDYERAIAEFETLPDASREAGRDFIEQIRARQELDELVSRVLDDTMSESE